MEEETWNLKKILAERYGEKEAEEITQVASILESAWEKDETEAQEKIGLYTPATPPLWHHFVEEAILIKETEPDKFELLLKTENRKLKHKKCGKELKSVSVWATHQVALYEKNAHGEWVEVPALEDYEDTAIEYYCNECGKPLDQDEVTTFEKALKDQDEGLIN